VTVTSYTSGALPGPWSFADDSGTASYSETEGAASLPPGDFIVADVANLGNATGYQGIGDTVDFLSGYGAPTLDIGEEGNGYVDQNNGDFYHRDASGWRFVLNIKGPQGDRGDQGPQGQTGPVGMVWKGTWTYGEGYFQRSVVYYNGSAYYAVYDVVPSTISPSADHTNWTLLAQAGSQGPQGATGPQGPGPQVAARSSDAPDITSNDSWVNKVPGLSISAPGRMYYVQGLVYVTANSSVPGFKISVFGDVNNEGASFYAVDSSGATTWVNPSSISLNVQKSGTAVQIQFFGVMRFTGWPTNTISVAVAQGTNSTVPIRAKAGSYLSIQQLQ